METVFDAYVIVPVIVILLLFPDLSLQADKVPSLTDKKFRSVASNQSLHDEICVGTKYCCDKTGTNVLL